MLRIVGLIYIRDLDRGVYISTKSFMNPHLISLPHEKATRLSVEVSRMIGALANRTAALDNQASEEAL